MLLFKSVEPLSLLEDYYSNKLNLEPPQIYNMGRLMNFKSYENLKSYSEERAKNGLPRYFPVLYAANDGVIATLPGKLIITFKIKFKIVFLGYYLTSLNVSFCRR